MLPIDHAWRVITVSAATRRVLLPSCPVPAGSYRCLGSVEVSSDPPPDGGMIGGQPSQHTP